MGIENFSASNSWISSFKQYHELVCKKLARESAAVDTDTMDLWLKSLPELLEGYEAWGIYNADETGLCFNGLPDWTLALKERTAMEEKVQRSNSVLLCRNSDVSDKRVPIITVKSTIPLCLKNLKNPPVTYCANSKAWMAQEISRDFLCAHDTSFSALRKKILHFVDNCATYSPGTSSLRKVKVVFYPSNCSSVVQPLDLGPSRCTGSS
jgi:hypothetical protein